VRGSSSNGNVLAVVHKSQAISLEELTASAVQLRSKCTHIVCACPVLVRLRSVSQQMCSMRGSEQCALHAYVQCE
jgi:hypothetical protein